jgi:hypothetical protein
MRWSIRPGTIRATIDRRFELDGVLPPFNRRLALTQIETIWRVNIFEQGSGGDLVSYLC